MIRYKLKGSIVMKSRAAILKREPPSLYKEGARKTEVQPI